MGSSLKIKKGVVVKKPKTFEEKKRLGFLKVIQRAPSHAVVLIFDALLPSNIFNNEEIIDAIKKALDRKVEFHILTSPDHDKNNPFFLTTFENQIVVKLGLPPNISFVAANNNVICYVSKNSFFLPKVTFLTEAPEAFISLVNLFSRCLKFSKEDQKEIIFAAMIAKLAEAKGLIPEEISQEAQKFLDQYDNPREAWRRFKESLEKDKA